MDNIYENPDKLENDEVYSNIPSFMKPGTSETLQNPVENTYESLTVSDPSENRSAPTRKGLSYKCRYIIIALVALTTGASVTGIIMFGVMRSDSQVRLEEYTHTHASPLRCSSSPCLNLGNCTDTSSSYFCTCQPGYQGAMCETEINECASNPCENGGHCIDGIDGYNCECEPGYDGEKCNIEVDTCKSSPCGSGGSCINGKNSFTCSCKDGSKGDKCDDTAVLCTRAIEIRDPTRRTCFVNEGDKCDSKDLTAGKWYRFRDEEGGDLVIPEYSPDVKRCNTHAPGWLNSSHPTNYGVSSRMVCYHWSDESCKWGSEIQVKRCDGFYIYQLFFPKPCNVRICTATHVHKALDDGECATTRN